MVAKDGRTVWIRESGTLVRAEGDGTQVWHGVMFDITELKRVERGLRETEERHASCRPPWSAPRLGRGARVASLLATVGFALRFSSVIVL